MSCSEEIRDKVVLGIVKEEFGRIVIGFTDGSELIIETIDDGDFEISFLNSKTNIKQLRNSLDAIDKALIKNIEARDEIQRKLNCFSV